MEVVSDNSNPHGGAKIFFQGPAPEQAAATVIFLHGRGAGAQDMLALYSTLGLANVAAIAPQANGNSWYPYSFLAPRIENEPHLTSALGVIGRTINDVVARGIPTSKIALLGFSQGACLASEFVARYPRQYGGLYVLTGGVIGPLGQLENYQGDLKETPVFLGTSDPDAHVPVERVKETAEVLTKLGGSVTIQTYSNMPHTINHDEVRIVKEMLLKLTK